MKKNNNSVLLSILCGVGVSFLCIGLIFLFSSENKTYLNDNNLNVGDSVVDDGGGGGGGFCSE